MARGRGRGAGIAVVAAAAIAGCTLITGVGDLDPSLEPGVDPNGGDSSSDGTTTSDTSSGSDGPAIDVTQPDTSTRIKDITFENGQIVHPQTGVDRVTGDAGLSLLTKDANVDESGDATTRIAIGGDFSLQASGPSFVEETFGPIDEVHLTARIRLDQTSLSTVPVLRIQPETGTTPIEIRLLSTSRLAVFLGAQIGQSSNPLTAGKVQRLGIFVRKGKNANGRLEVFLADDAAPFTTPFAQSANIDFERPEKLQLGVATPGLSITFDDVKLDATELPPL